MGQLIEILKEIEISTTRAFLERDFTKPDDEFFTLQIKDDEYLCGEYKKSGTLEIEILKWKEILKIKNFLDNKKIPHEIHNREEIIIPNYKRYFAIRGKFRDYDDEVEDIEEIEIKLPKRIWDFSKYIPNFDPKNIRIDDIMYNLLGDKAQYKVKNNFPSQNILCSVKYEWAPDFNKIPSSYWSHESLVKLNNFRKPKLNEIKINPGQLDIYYKEWYEHYNKFKEKIEDSGFKTFEDAENVYEEMREKIADKLNVSLDTNKINGADFNNWEWIQKLEKIDNAAWERFELKYGITYWDIEHFFWGLKKYSKQNELQEIEIKPNIVDAFLKPGHRYYIQDQPGDYKAKVKFLGKYKEYERTDQTDPGFIVYKFKYDIIWMFEYDEMLKMIKNKLITKVK